METKQLNSTVYKVGYWSGLAAFAATTAFVIVQTLQLMRVLTYPWDEISIYGTSLCIVVPFVLEMLALHYIVLEDKKYWSHAALIFTVLYAAFVTANYIVQLTTVIPSTLKGTDADIQILKQTPHSLFWDFDAIGYIFMGLATLFAIPIFKNEGLQKWVRYALIAHTVVTPLIVFVYFYPTFSERLLLIGVPWGITAPVFMLMLALMFKTKKIDKL
jgi:hypothetical protein